MFLMLSKKPRKNSRNRSARYRASLKAKNKRRQARVYQAHRALKAAFSPRRPPVRSGCTNMYSSSLAGGRLDEKSAFTGRCCGSNPVVTFRFAG